MTTASKSIYLKPVTRLGWWAVGLAIGFFVLMPLWSVFALIGLGAFPAFICGIAGGIVGLVAVIKQQERSVLVYLAIIPLLFVVFFVIAEFVFPH